MNLSNALLGRSKPKRKCNKKSILGWKKIKIKMMTAKAKRRNSLKRLIYSKIFGLILLVVVNHQINKT